MFFIVPDNGDTTIHKSDYKPRRAIFFWPVDREVCYKKDPLRHQEIIDKNLNELGNVFKTFPNLIFCTKVEILKTKPKMARIFACQLGFS